MAISAKKLNVYLAVLIVIAATLNGTLIYMIANSDGRHNNNTPQDQGSGGDDSGGSPGDDSGDTDDDEDTGDDDGIGEEVSTKVCSSTAGANGLRNMAFDDMLLDYSSELWGVECKTLVEPGEREDSEWATFSLKANSSIRVVFYIFAFYGAGPCFFGDEIPTAQTFAMVGRTKSGLAIIQPAHDEKVSWTPTGVSASANGVFVVDHGVTESAVQLITNCVAGGMLETAGSHDRNYASFFSMNDWGGLTLAEQTEVIALLSSLNKR